jgi:prophage antirepressor-like protein
MKMKAVGHIKFDGYILEVYDSLDEPLFKAVEVAKLIDYSVGNTAHMLKTVEHDEKIMLSTRNSSTTARGNATPVWFITELGLYNVFSQSRKPIARKWRRVVHSNLILLRKQNQLTIDGQFEEWDALAEDLFIDPDTGILMEIRTVQGGDVEVEPYEE